MRLTPRLKPPKYVVDRALVPHDQPHRLVKIDIILELNLLIDLLLGELLEVVLSRNLLPLRQLPLDFLLIAVVTFALVVVLFSVLVVECKSGLAQIVIDGHLVVEDVEPRVQVVKCTRVQLVVGVFALIEAVGSCIVVTYVVDANIVECRRYLTFRIVFWDGVTLR